MMKNWKSYWVFTSFLYKIVMFLGIPLGLAGISLWAGSNLGSMGVFSAALLFPAIEIISDYWLFAGIQAKDPVRMDYLKTSGRGMRLMRNALITDLMRKFVSAAGILAMSWGVIWLRLYLAGGDMIRRNELLWNEVWSGEAPNKVWFLLYLAALGYFFSVLGTFLARYGNMLWVGMLIGYTATLLEVLCLLLPGLGKHTAAYFLLFGVLGLAVSVLTVRTGMKKIRSGYYD